MVEHDHPAQEPDAAPPAAATRRGPALALILALLLAVAGGGYAWYTQGRVAVLEQELAAVTGERDAARAAQGQAQAALDQAQATLGQMRDEQAGQGARGQALEQELAQAREELARLQAAAAAPPAPAPTADATAAAPATITELQELATGAGPAPSADPAPPAPEPTGEPTPLIAAPEPEPAPTTPAPAPAPETLTITFDVNSSYFPASLDGRLRRLAQSLQPGQAYAVRLTGSVGADPVANGGGEGDAASYNRWIAERRMTRVADFLQDNSDTLSLAIEQAFVTDDPSRRVVVEVRPVQP